MNKDFFKEFALKYKNLVFIGEAGSGKTETALNLAQGLMAMFKAEGVDRPVHFFDMDQTKANLRARDAAAFLEANDVILHYEVQELDMPTVVGGVVEHLKNPEVMVFMDVGGGSHGSHMIGQFSEHLTGEDTAVLYVINPYRPWSVSRQEIDTTMERVLGAGRLSASFLVCNPNLGPGTTVEEFMSGYNKMLEMFPDEPVHFCFATETICSDVEKLTGIPTYPVKVTAPPVWLYDFID